MAGVAERSEVTRLSEESKEWLEVLKVCLGSGGQVSQSVTEGDSESVRVSEGGEEAELSVCRGGISLWTLVFCRAPVHRFLSPL